MPGQDLGTTEKWVFTNPTGQPHTVHIHDVSQQCVSRNGGACYPYETMKETWYLTPGEVLEVKLKFTDHTGLFMLHCHMVEHEDDGMMTQFEVVPRKSNSKATTYSTPSAIGIPCTIAMCALGTNYVLPNVDQPSYFQTPAALAKTQKNGTK